MNRKREEIPVATQLRVIRLAQAGKLSRRSIGKEFGIHHATVGDFLERHSAGYYEGIQEVAV